MAIRKSKIDLYIKTPKKDKQAFEQRLNSPEYKEALSSAENKSEFQTKMRLFNHAIQNSELDHLLDRLPPIAGFIRRLQKHFNDVQKVDTTYDTVFDNYKDVISLVYIMTEECRVHELLDTLKNQFPEYFE